MDGPFTILATDYIPNFSVIIMIKLEIRKQSLHSVSAMEWTTEIFK